MILQLGLASLYGRPIAPARNALNAIKVYYGPGDDKITTYTANNKNYVKNKTNNNNIHLGVFIGLMLVFLYRYLPGNKVH